MAISSDIVRIVITGAPVPYRTRASVANGRVWSYRPQHVKQYQDHLRRACDDAMTGRRLFEGAVCCTVRAFMPMPKTMRKADRFLAERELLPHVKKPDLDGLIKAAHDALKGRVWRDDSQAAMYGQPFKVYSPRPRLEIEVRAITTIADVKPIATDDAAPIVRFVQQALL